MVAGLFVDTVDLLRARRNMQKGKTESPGMRQFDSTLNLWIRLAYPILLAGTSRLCPRPRLPPLL